MQIGTPLTHPGEFTQVPRFSQGSRSFICNFFIVVLFYYLCFSTSSTGPWSTVGTQYILKEQMSGKGTWQTEFFSTGSLEMKNTNLKSIKSVVYPLGAALTQEPTFRQDSRALRNVCPSTKQINIWEGTAVPLGFPGKTP